MRRSVALKLTTVVALLIFAMAAHRSSFAQVQAGRIVGTVTDPNKSTGLHLCE